MIIFSPYSFCHSWLSLFTGVVLIFLNNRLWLKRDHICSFSSDWKHKQQQCNVYVTNTKQKIMENGVKTRKILLKNPRILKYVFKITVITWTMSDQAEWLEKQLIKHKKSFYING